MIIHEFKQNSEEWFEIRIGKITASDFHHYYGSSETKKKMLRVKASERITGMRSDVERFSNKHMDRGHEQEPDAVYDYYLETGNKVKQVGFVELNDWVGCSPDGLVNEDGLIECKSQDFNLFMKLMEDGKITPIYNTQMQFNMFVTGRKWCDFVSYNPKFSKPLIIVRVERDEEEMKRIEETIEIVKKEIELKINKYQS